ncbi:MAG: hypothetical protein IJK66_01685 [Bacilli bacterium]|nr:hypothetical protein [Bacilli bacterium]
MKKLRYLLLMLLFIPITTLAKYDVIDSRCTNSFKTALRSDANDVVYRLSKNIENDKVTYKVIFYNITKHMYLADSNGKKYSSNVIDGLTPGSKIQVIIYASNNNYCEGYKILTKVINVPYYNKYSKSDLCKGYENYFLCKENSNVNLSEKEFEKKMNEYIESLNKREETEIKPQENDETNIDVLGYIYEHRHLIIVSLTIILLVLLRIIMKRRSKNRGIL